jgi:hypothetical protein
MSYISKAFSTQNHTVLATTIYVTDDKILSMDEDDLLLYSTINNMVLDSFNAEIPGVECSLAFYGAEHIPMGQLMNLPPMESLSIPVEADLIPTWITCVRVRDSTGLDYALVFIPVRESAPVPPEDLLSMATIHAGENPATGTSMLKDFFVVKIEYNLEEETPPKVYDSFSAYAAEQEFIEAGGVLQ